MIGRKQERQKLDYLLYSDKAELMAVIGRRRVGKTYLIKEHYQEKIVFDFTGTQFAKKDNQLKKFSLKLQEYHSSPIPPAIPSDWAEAFFQLKLFLKSLTATKFKPVVFFDEVPWIDSRRSGFLKELGYWWNDWASRQNIIVIVCGSAASWMIEKVVNNKGGLHNRITEYIYLKPFTLTEVKQYIHVINPVMDDYQILQLYMSIGGIPHYLQHIRKGESATQIINRLCFKKDGILRNEFNNLYAALYEEHERHISVVRALSTKWKGLTRKEIIQETRISNGGGLTKILTELITSSFVMEIMPFGKKKKDTLYRLVDEYSLFYLSFIAGNRPSEQNIWLQNSQNQNYKIWRGYAFENICIKHVEAIKIALGITGIQTEISGYRSTAKTDGSGLQIDLLIDRADNSINLCEIKFYNSELTITKQSAEKLRRRRARFQEISKTKKTIFNTLITTYGIHTNEHSFNQVDHCITMDALFVLDHFDS